MINWFKKKSDELDIEFVDVTRQAYTYHPIEMAKDVRAPFTDSQIKKYGSFKFVHCPGMADYKNYGYVITAWDDIHIIANKAGCLSFVGGGPNTKRPSNFTQPKKMATDIGDGIFKPNEVPYEVVHIGSPWKVMTKNNISVFIMPAFYHSTFLDDLYIYPGIVDYGNFSEINFIFSPKRECNIVIKAGEPILQIIPFNPQEIKAGYGPPTQFQEDKSRTMISSAKQFYRKFAMHFKPTTLESINRP